MEFTNQKASYKKSTCVLNVPYLPTKVCTVLYGRYSTVQYCTYLGTYLAFEAQRSSTLVEHVTVPLLLNVNPRTHFPRPLLHTQLTPQHPSSCSRTHSALRYELALCFSIGVLMIAALLDRPRRETASTWRSFPTHLHHPFCGPSRFVVLLFSKHQSGVTPALRGPEIRAPPRLLPSLARARARPPARSAQR